MDEILSALPAWVLQKAPEDGRPHQKDNFFARERTNIGSPKPLTAGRHAVRCEFIRALAALGAGGRCMLSVDGELVAEGFIPKTQPFAFPGDEGTDVGLDGGTNASPDYLQHGNELTGTIRKVTAEVK